MSEFSSQYSLENKTLMRRYTNTLNFLEKHVNDGANIYDMGIENLLGELMTNKGYHVSNTERGIDLDVDYEKIDTSPFDVVTAFEIFEHLVAPFNILRHIKAPKLVASIPLSLWFTKAYWNDNDPWDRHYHEFEPRQFDMVLEKAGWKIKDSEKWTSPGSGIGIRPLLRRFYPRYYIVYCTRS